MLITAQANAKAIGAQVEGRGARSDPMAVAVRIAAQMVNTVKTTTAGDKIRADQERITLPLARDEPNPHDGATYLVAAKQTQEENADFFMSGQRRCLRQCGVRCVIMRH